MLPMNNLDHLLMFRYSKYEYNSNNIVIDDSFTKDKVQRIQNLHVAQQLLQLLRFQSCYLQ